jgi:hypothetical protein
MCSVVPPGKFYDAGVVKSCPMGTYREGTLPYVQATSCAACGEGISTVAAGSTRRQDCTGWCAHVAPLVKAIV